jgi:hypothetical protein
VVADVEEGCDMLALLLVDGREKGIIAFHIGSCCSCDSC